SVLARRICQKSDTVLVARVGRRVRNFHAVPLHVELPAVVDTAQAAFLVSPVVEARPAMRASRLHDTDPAFRVAERNQILAEYLEPDRRAIRLGNLPRKRHRKPEAAEVRPSRGSGPGSCQKLVVLRAQHGALPSPSVRSIPVDDLRGREACARPFCARAADASRTARPSRGSRVCGPWARTRSRSTPSSRAAPSARTRTESGSRRIQARFDRGCRRFACARSRGGIAPGAP